MNISEKTRALAAKAESELREIFEAIDEVSRYRTEKLLDIYRENRVSEGLFAASTGYGYGDRGRDTIDKICAEVMGAEAGFMRPSILCGTHAITIGLFALLRPGDVMLSVTGSPYDTLHSVVGMDGADGTGSLADFGVEYAEVPLGENGGIDFEGMAAAFEKYKGRIKVVFIQRSKGYMDRKTLSVSEIGEAAAFAHSRLSNEHFVVLDNCYG
ncbi:MAG: methionine gamma-lyase family protein, partial [Clostridia bacterium]|nr:methionine gamma-lyase family protein [Clostridia bacterium]